MEYRKPIPTIKPWTKPFWDGAKNRELLLQRGVKSGKYIMYPKKYSPYDYTEEIEWVKASGKGKIYTYTIVRNNPPEVFKEDLPYVIAFVDLEEGVRMCTRIIESDFEKIKIGAEVEAVYEDATDDITFVYFKIR
jgi:uncharacterized OB-fold protein